MTTNMQEDIGVRVFLDANAWIDVLHRKFSAGERMMFNVLARSKIIDIVLSSSVVEELNKSIGSNEESRKLYTTYIEQCTMERLLYPLSIRMAAEWVCRRELTDAEQFIFEYQQGWLTNILGVEDWSHVGSEVDKKKHFFHSSWKNASKRIFSELDEKQSKKQTRSERDIIEENLIESAATRCQLWWEVKTETEKVETFRTNISHRMYELIRLHVEHYGKFGQNHGDIYDQTHYADARGTRCKYIVTNDRKFSEITNHIKKLVPDSPTAITTEDFRQMILVLHDGALYIGNT